MNLKHAIRILEKNKQILREKFKVKRIGLFGSITRNEHKEASDVDVIVEFTERIGWEIADLKESLEKILGVEVDIVTKNAAMSKQLFWESIKWEIVYV